MNADINIEELISTAYEIEGLLYLAMHRGHDTPGQVWDMIAAKAAAIQAAATPSPAMPDEPSGPAEPVIVEQPELEVKPFEAEAEPVVMAETEPVFIEELELELEPEPETEPEQEPSTDDDDDDNEPITLDEKLARDNSRDLRRAFSINDRFRFRRELFGNSDSEMADAINLVEAMASAQEADDYFFGDLEWDRENPDVQAFMDIITRHFKNR